MKRFLVLPLFLAGLLISQAPAQERKPVSRIVFGSCAHQDKDQGFWKPILEQKPDLFLFLGDNIYGDSSDIAVLRGKYNQLGEQDGYKKLKALCPILATWDDHDYGKNDAGAEFEVKKESQELFLDFFGVPKTSPRRKQEGVYHAQVFGPEGKRVQVILLDTRYHRSPLKLDARKPRNLGQYVASDDENATILGEAQWKWLEEQLKVPAEVRLLCSSVQVVAEDHGFEKWMNFPRERARLYELIRNTRAAGLIVLSGDRHLAELSSMDAEVGYQLLDLTSSGLNQGNSKFRQLEPNRHRVATMDRGNNYGMVRIDWEREDPLLSLEIQDDDGDVIIRHKVNLSRLQPVARKPTKVVRGGTNKNENPNLAAEARKHEGKEWKFTMTVQGAGASKDKARIFLNSEKDFRSEKNLTIVLEMKALQAALTEAKIKDPRKHFSGKKVEITGTVTMFRENPQVVIKQLDQIKILD
ncbi:MAG: alkaline phosphatase D family protein [Gemmataceae bacterium]